MDLEEHTTIPEARPMLRRAHEIVLRVGNLWVDRLSDRPGRKQAVAYYIPEQVDRPFPNLCAQAFPREFRFNFYRRSAIVDSDWPRLRRGPNQMPRVSSNDVSDAEIEQILRRYIAASPSHPVREYRYETAMHLLLEKALPHHRFVKERLDDMRNPQTQRPLEFDFFCRTIGLAIEVQGEHHYVPVSYRGKDDAEVAMDRLEDRKSLDKLKAEYCLERGIGLIQVKADQFERQVGVCGFLSSEWVEKAGVRDRLVSSPCVWQSC